MPICQSRQIYRFTVISAFCAQTAIRALGLNRIRCLQASSVLSLKDETQQRPVGDPVSQRREIHLINCDKRSLWSDSEARFVCIPYGCTWKSEDFTDIKLYIVS